ncbi:MAG: hypothetical protein ACE5LU_27545 [Anaerolineae bacterium]
MKRLAFIATLLIGLAAPAVSGDLDRRSITRYNEWNPDGCYKPSPPISYAYDVDSYNWAVEEFNAYVSEIQMYLSCIASEAADDLRTFRRILEDSVGRLNDEAMSEVESARSDLEFARSSLR